MGIEELRELKADARAEVERIRRTVLLTSAVLDEWRGAYRIIYGGPGVPRCPSSCEGCALFKAVGPDDDNRIQEETARGVVEFHPTLVKPTREDHELVADQRAYLNCKTLGQYAEFYISWTVRKCQTEHEIREELELVAGFSVVYASGFDDLYAIETFAKRFIVDSCLARMPAEDPRRTWIVDRASSLGLLV